MEKMATQPKQNLKINSKDIYQTVTDTIIQQLERGIIPWQKPWKGEAGALPQLPINYTTNNRYRGINIVLLWSAALEKNYASNEWASFKQWQSKNEVVKKGEKGNLVVYYDTFEKEKDGEIEKIPFLKSSYVFNRTQLVGYVAPPVIEPTGYEGIVEKIDLVEHFVSNTKASIGQHDGGACYIPTKDQIMMPYQEQFFDTDTCTATEGFYSTLLHELTHWSGSEMRLNRANGKRFGDNNYATEELVAEFGAAFLCSGFGIRTLEKGDHAGYIQSWLRVLKENKQCLFTAASEASKAVDYLYSLNCVD